MKLSDRVIEELRSNSDVAVTALTRRERQSAIQRWRTTFAEDLFRDTGRWVLHGIEWHAFTYPRHLSLAHVLGRRATAAFEERVGRDDQFLVLPGESRADFGFHVEGHLSSSGIRDLQSDVIVCGEGFGWTMVYTHEPSCGPFFVEAPARRFDDDEGIESPTASAPE